METTPDGPTNDATTPTDSGTEAQPAGAGSTVGVSDTSITISYATPFSGPNGQVANLFFQGFLTWRDDVNQRGGIHGRQVIVKRVDHQGTPEGAVAACKEAQSNGSFMTIEVGEAKGFADCLDAAAIPVLASGVTKVKTWPHLRSFFLQPDLGRLVASYTKGKLGGATKKIGVIHTTLARDADTAGGFLKGARERDLNVVAVEKVNQGQASFVSELLRLRDAGAEVVAIFAVVEAIGILRDAKAIRYEPAFTGETWCFDAFSIASPELFRGIQCLRKYPGAERPEYAEFKKKAAATGNNVDTTEAWIVYGYGLTVGKVLETAGKQLTREGFIAAFEQITGYGADGVLPPMNQWRPGGSVIGTFANFPMVCCNPDNTWKTLGPAKEEF